jgi:hypothetical protein
MECRRGCLRGAAFAPLGGRETCSFDRREIGERAYDEPSPAVERIHFGVVRGFDEDGLAVRRSAGRIGERLSVSTMDAPWGRHEHA